MLVRLTKTQLSAVDQAFTNDGMPWVKERWLDQAQPLLGHTTMVEAVMPAIGWQMSLTLLIELTVGPLGGNRAAATKAALNARSRIATAVATYSAHPALFDVGLLGEHYDIIPAWRTGGSKPSRLYDVLPVKNATFMLLLPERQRRFTVWRAQAPSGHGIGNLLDEAAHLRFLNDRAAAATGPASDP